MNIDITIPISAPIIPLHPTGVPQRGAAKAAEQKIRKQSSRSSSPTNAASTPSSSTPRALKSSKNSKPQAKPSRKRSASEVEVVAKPELPRQESESTSQSTTSSASSSPRKAKRPNRVRAGAVASSASSSDRAQSFSRSEEPTSVTPESNTSHLRFPVLDTPDPSLPLAKPSESPSPPSTEPAPPVRSNRRQAAQKASNSIQRAYVDFLEHEVEASSSQTKSKGSRTRKPRTDDGYVSSPSKQKAKKDALESTGSRPVFRQFEHNGHTWEIQQNSCKASRYRTWRRCTHCIAKQSSDTCRFIGIRAIPFDVTIGRPFHDAETDLKPALLSTREADAVLQFPSHNVSAADLAKVKAVAAQSLLPVLEAELSHANHPDTLRRQRETTCRQTCEFCSTSIFSASWLCRRCGREYCPDCKQAIEHIESVEAEQARGLTLCARPTTHTSQDLVPLTRLDTEMLREEIQVMKDCISQGSLQSTPYPEVAHELPTASSRAKDETQPEEINWKEFDKRRAGLEADRIVGTLPLRTFDKADISTSLFENEWASGEPLLVRNVIADMKHTWDPDAFIQKYGEDPCHIVRSDIDAPPEAVQVATFFETFGRTQEEKEAILGKGSWKLKDWPPAEEFKKVFPELYQDFNLAVPAPDYTTREGALNLGSYYPEGVLQPDLGPKMYNAWPASEAPRGKGTTRLHMDIADAVNIMLYASPPRVDDLPEEHNHGVAAWDIFPAEDADKIRAFLRKENPKEVYMDDPIHTQRFFIDAKQRVKLFREFGVKSWRIYQKVGEAVFIPAGCAHQVCNLADCIKVAVDFVSPQNVARCFKLTSEFREMVHDYKKGWKQDVLSLRTTLWYAWLAYRHMEDEGLGQQPEASNRPIKMIPQEPAK